MMIDGIGAGFLVKQRIEICVYFLSFQNHTKITGNNFFKIINSEEQKEHQTREEEQ